MKQIHCRVVSKGGIGSDLGFNRLQNAVWVARIEQGTSEEEAATVVQVATDGAGKGEGESWEALWICFECGGFLSVCCEGVRRLKELTFILWSMV